MIVWLQGSGIVTRVSAAHAVGIENPYNWAGYFASTGYFYAGY